MIVGFRREDSGGERSVVGLRGGDQLIPGSIRTQGVTGWTCVENLGANDVVTWQLSVTADAQNSFAATGGDVGE